MRAAAALGIFLIGATPATATPDAGIAVADALVAAGPDSYVVLRTTSLWPPSYYAYAERLEYVALALADATIRSRCLIAEATYATDAADPDATRQRTGLTTGNCDLGAMLAAADAAPVMPEAGFDEPDTFALVDDGLAATRDVESRPIWPLAEVAARFTAATMIPGTALFWAPEPGAVAIYGEGFPFDPAECRADAAVRRPEVGAHVFVRLHCWGGSIDFSGADLWLAVPDTTLRAVRGE